MLLEKTAHLSDTIFKYQKGKHVMATPAKLVLRSDLDFDAGKREAILALWDSQIAEAQVNVRFDAEVTGITGEAGDFTLTLKDGSTIAAEAVVLAIGTQGNPNLVRCPVGTGAVVQYQLDDPAEYNDEHVFVIGGGDAGIENALGLAADPAQGNVVHLVNRSADFATAKDANIKALMAARDAGRMTIHLETTASQIDRGEIALDTRDGAIKVRCDRVIARMGSAPPRKFVEAAGVAFSSEDRLAFPVRVVSRAPEVDPRTATRCGCRSLGTPL